MMYELKKGGRKTERRVITRESRKEKCCEEKVTKVIERKEKIERR